LTVESLTNAAMLEKPFPFASVPAATGAVKSMSAMVTPAPPTPLIVSATADAVVITGDATVARPPVYAQVGDVHDSPPKMLTGLVIVTVSL
jgi:hypothetical protein